MLSALIVLGYNIAKIMRKFIFRISFFLYILHIGLLTLLYTGTISIFSVKYFILNDIVKKLKQGSIPVGGIFGVASEILRNEIVVNTENVKPISEHVSKHLGPVSDVLRPPPNPLHSNKRLIGELGGGRQQGGSLV